MKTALKFIAAGIGLLSILIFTPGIADASVSVRGYYRKNGTYVAPHYRSDPDSSPYNNWSYPGNTNPYTGVTAGGSTSSYLNSYYNYPSYSLGTYTSPSYSSSGLSSYSSSIVDVPGGVSYSGSVLCNVGYYTRNNACIPAPDHAKAYGFSDFYCESGFTKNKAGTACLTAAGLCADSDPNAEYDTQKQGCYCIAGHFINKDTNNCVSSTTLCQKAYGLNSRGGDDGKCSCESGYEFIEQFGSTMCAQTVSCAADEIKKDNTCIKREDACHSLYGENSTNIGGSEYCYCKLNASWSDDLKSCSGSAKKITSILKNGDTGSEVAVLQNFLGLKGYNNLGINGVFDDATKIALRKFQKENKLPVSGKTTVSTQQKINYLISSTLVE